MQGLTVHGLDRKVSSTLAATRVVRKPPRGGPHVASTCRVAGCDQHATAARKMCWKHYQRWLRYGHPLAVPKRTRWEDRVLSRVPRPPIGCWLYPSESERPPRLRSPEGARVEARVVVWEELVGPLPLGHRLTPLCGVRNCVNPHHHQITHEAA